MIVPKLAPIEVLVLQQTCKQKWRRRLAVAQSLAKIYDLIFSTKNWEGFLHDDIRAPAASLATPVPAPAAV